ncbi:DUF523 domain-containing protein [Desulfovibrionales bacterium]
MILVSACLAGFACRWNGEDCAHPHVVQLVQTGAAVPLCPEQLGGLTTPREPCELQNGRVVCKSGLDVTDAFARGAEMTVHLAKLYGCTHAIMKSRSPSCGCGRIHDGTFAGILVEGNGVTVDALLRAGLTVQTENDL